MKHFILDLCDPGLLSLAGSTLLMFALWRYIIWRENRNEAISDAARNKADGI